MRAGDVAQVIVCLLSNLFSKCEALSSNPGTAKKKKSFFLLPKKIMNQGMEKAMCYYLGC
jgi:hypothetical protein